MPELIPAEPGSPEWLAARRAGVTATDIVTILGLSSRDSMYSLFWRKLGQVPEVPDSDRFRLGRELEPYVWDRWYEVTGDEDSHTYPAGLWCSSERPWMLATLDALYRARPVELKTWADADRHAWGESFAGSTGVPPADSAHRSVAGDRSSKIAGSPKDGARPGPIAPKIPAAVRAQLLWQMDVMGVSTGHVGVVFLPSGEFRSYVIEHNGNCYTTDVLELDDSKPLCSICDDQELMRMQGQEFIARLRLDLPPPDPDSSAATLAAVRARFARQPAKQADVDPGTWQQWADFKNAAAVNEDNARKFEILLREQAGEAAEYTVGGQLVARRIVSDAQVKAHVRHQDYIRRIKQQGDDDEG